MPFLSYGFRTTFTGSNTNAILKGQDEYFAITRAPLRPGSACFHDSVHCQFHEVFINRDLQLHLTHKMGVLVLSAVNFGLPALPAKSLHINHGKPEDLNVVESFFHSFQPRSIDNGKDQLHDTDPFRVDFGAQGDTAPIPAKHDSSTP
jgi:hypothetical protein